MWFLKSKKNMKCFIILLTFLMSSSLNGQTTVQPFKLTEVKLLPSRFLDNMKRDSAWIQSIPVNSLLHSFRTNAGLFSSKEGGYMTMKRLGGWESLDCDLRGHITGHLLSAMAYLQMKEKADSLVQGLAEVQQQIGTGYLSAFGEGLIDRNIAGKSVWAPFYTLHKILQGLIDQYNLCGNEKALAVARGMGNWAYNKLSQLDEDTRQIMIRNEFGGFNEAMYNLYAITKDERHLQVAQFFYHNDKIDPLKKGNPDLGTYHANTFIPKLLGECRNYELFQNQDSRKAAELLFKALSQDHAFVTGEVSDKEHLFKPDTQFKHLSGYDGENCCTYNLLKLAERLFTYEPRAYIADYYERALYNHILGQQDPQSSMVCYFTPLKTGCYRLYSTRDSSFWCCVGSGFESHAKYQSAIYFHDNGNLKDIQRISHRKSKDISWKNKRYLYVNLFIPSELKWDGMTIRQDTRFPESNKTVLTIANPKDFTMKLRYPSWATYMKINGKKVKAGKDGYVSVDNPRRVEVEFGMALREEMVKGDSSLCALVYGPVVLAGELEKVDNPFSNPQKYNDYYTYDYGKYNDVEYHSLNEFSPTSPLHYLSSDGIVVKPFYDLHHHRYVVYWKKAPTQP